MNSALLLLFSVASLVGGAPSVEEYMLMRDQVIEMEDAVFLGGTTTLDDRERLVNQILMEFKEREYAQGLDGSNGDWFATTKHIFHALDLIESSNVFRIIKLMPKGCALHMHDVTVAPTTSFLNISTWENLYYCMGERNELLFRFFPVQPSFGCVAGKDWKPMAGLRDQAPSQEWVDEFLFKNMNMRTATPDVEYPDTNVAWEMFERKITTASGMGNYAEAYKQYYYDTLKYHLDDNVMYVEMRGLLASVYNLNQSELSALSTLRLLKETTDEFLVDYPDFLGAKYIYAPHRFHSPPDIGIMINEAVRMKETFPEYFAGFDLVGQEDKGSPLLTFLPQLLDATDKGVQFFFHAGETDWRGTRVDENLIDAVLLNTTRFGHGFALYSHPYLYEKAREQGIAVEVCPISNQVLGLVKDFRNHPGFNYFRDDFPVVIAADGPGIFGVSALSHDYYVAFMALGGKRADLRFLKKLAANSIEYSAMSPAEKVIARGKWEAKWSEFLDKVINDFVGSKYQNLMSNEILP